MSKVQILRAFVNLRLTAAAEEIFGLFERTIAEYEEELCCSTENHRRGKLLDAAFNPEVRLRRADVQQLLVSQEQVSPEQQECSPILDQEDSPEPACIKERKEELWASHEEEQLQGLEEADVDNLLFTPDPVKADDDDDDDDEEKAQSSQLQRATESPTSSSAEQMKTETEGGDCQGSEPAGDFHPDRCLQPYSIDDIKRLLEARTEDGSGWMRTREPRPGYKFPFNPVPVKSEDDDEERAQSSQIHHSQREENRDAEHLKIEPEGEEFGRSERTKTFNPDRYLQPGGYDKTSHASESETDDSSYDLEETREPQSGLNLLKNSEIPARDIECHAGKTSVSSSECATNLGHKGHLQEHMQIQPFGCSVCGKRFPQSNLLITHMRLHSEEKRFCCSVCKKRCRWSGDIVKHTRIHSGEKPFSCSICGRGFLKSCNLISHIRVHTGEKPFTCSVCKTSFRASHTLINHMRIHTGEKPFSCSVCGKRFVQHGHLKQHMTVHTGEKPFSCNICDKRFTRLAYIKRHKCAGESSRNRGGDAC